MTLAAENPQQARDGGSMDLWSSKQLGECGVPSLTMPTKNTQDFRNQFRSTKGAKKRLHPQRRFITLKSGDKFSTNLQENSFIPLSVTVLHPSSGRVRNSLPALREARGSESKARGCSRNV